VRRVAIAVVFALAVAACGGGDDDDEGAVRTSTTLPVTTIPSTGSFDGMIDVDGHGLHLVCQGAGEPIVIVEMGAGQRVSAWNGTQPELAADNRTCVYERAGTGASEPGPAPRTSQRIADELHALIVAAGLPTPVIVLSHSLGGMDAQAFAQQHADDVAALVFVEPRTAEYQQTYRDLLTASEREADQQDVDRAARTEPFGPELAVIDDSADAIVEAGDLPDVPVIVLTAGVPFPDQPQEDIDLWRATHEHLAAQVSDGRATIVDGADHEIWRTHSNAVVAAVHEVAAAL
jgi:pimeloyl-ACP methyl ester carboxylesterase